MLLTPRYEGDVLVRLDGLVDDAASPTLRQRARLAATLAELDDRQWAAPSRCEGWSVQDVVSHLTDTNQFWAYSLSSGLAGEPSRFLASFDPVATPAQLVAANRAPSPAEALHRFVASNEALAATIDGIEGDAWSLPGEAPPGHVALRLVVLHALWDSWIHERDVLLPLGLPPTDEPDEVEGCLVYAAALSCAFLAAGGSTRTGALEVAAHRPDLGFVVEAGSTVVVHPGPAPEGAAVLAGDAVALVEALSHRAPFPSPLPESHRWLLTGLAEVFDVAS